MASGSSGYLYNNLSSTFNARWSTSVWQAEVIKAAVIADRSFVDWLLVNLPAVLRRDPPAIHEAVARAIAIKAAVVAKDPQDTGSRAIPKRLGFTQEGVQKDAEWLYDHFVDLVMYSMLASQWLVASR